MSRRKNFKRYVYFGFLHYVPEAKMFLPDCVGAGRSLWTATPRSLCCSSWISWSIFASLLLDVCHGFQSTFRDTNCVTCPFLTMRVQSWVWTEFLDSSANTVHGNIPVNQYLLTSCFPPIWCAYQIAGM